MAAVLHHSKAKGTDKLILVGIANHEGDGGAWPAIATLAKYGNVDPRSARRSIRNLEALGELRVHLNGGGTLATRHSERPNRYDVLVGCPAECDGTTRHRVKAQVDTPRTPTSGGDAYVRGEGTPTSGHPRTPTSPKPSFESPVEPPTPTHASDSPSAPDETVVVDQPARKTKIPTPRSSSPAASAPASHPHHERTAAAIARRITDAQLPVTAADVLAHAYRVGVGDPWRGYQALTDALGASLAGAIHPGRVMLTRLENLAPIPGRAGSSEVPLAMQCPDHPGQHGGHCDECARAAYRPAGGLRELRKRIMAG